MRSGLWWALTLLIAAPAHGQLGHWLRDRIDRKVRASVKAPELVVLVPYPGASPAEVEATILQPVEAALSAVPGVTRLTSTALEGHGRVVVTLKLGTEVFPARQRLSEALQAVTLPEDAEVPQVFSPLRKEGHPVALVPPAGAPPRAAFEALRRQMPAVAPLLTTCDGGLPLLTVRLSERAAAFGLTHDHVSRALQQALSPLPSGPIGHGPLIRVQSSGALSPDLVLSTTPEGQPIYLRDVADLSVEPDPDACHCWAAGQRAVCGVMPEDTHLPALRAEIQATGWTLALAPSPERPLVSIEVRGAKPDDLMRALDRPDLRAAHAFAQVDKASARLFVDGDPAMVQRLLTHLTAQPGLQVIALPGGQAAGLKSARLVISGGEPEDRTRATDQVTRVGGAHPSTLIMVDALEPPRPSIQLEAANRLVPARLIAQAVRLATVGLNLGHGTFEGRKHRIRLFVGQRPGDLSDLSTDLDALQRVLVTLPDGAQVPLGQVAHITLGLEPSTRQRVDLKPARVLTLWTLPEHDPQRVAQQILTRVTLPVGVSVALQPSSGK